MCLFFLKVAFESIIGIMINDKKKFPVNVDYDVI
jgi:hypothetical protein